MKFAVGDKVKVVNWGIGWTEVTCEVIAVPGYRPSEGRYSKYHKVRVIDPGNGSRLKYGDEGGFDENHLTLVEQRESSFRKVSLSDFSVDELLTEVKRRMN
jgi:hypothetical protein